MIYYGIYKITNLLNGKMYIGQHTTNNLDDGYMGSGIVIRHALKKNGNENFRKEWLMFCEDEEELNYMERVYVDQTWIDRADTYNLAIGGNSARGENHPMFGRQHNEETRKKISDSRQDYVGEKHPFYGKHHTKETKDKISQGHIGIGHPMSEEQKRKLSLKRKGMKFPKEWCKNISKGKIGKPSPRKGCHQKAWNKGLVGIYTEDAIERMKAAAILRNNGRNWYTDGVHNMFCYECPEGFHKGRTTGWRTR